MKKLRILVDARVGVGLGGGVETLVRGLAKGYAGMVNDKFEVVFLVNYGGSKLIQDQDPSGALQVVEVSAAERDGYSFGKLRSLLRLFKFYLGLPIPYKFVMQRDKVSEQLNPNLIHYTYQATFHTQIPFVYHPHDLQHKYFPGNFSLLARIFRDANYSLMCQQSSAIAVSSKWVKDDLVRFYSIQADKIRVIHLAPLTQDSIKVFSFPIRDESIEEKDEPNFLLYPAVNWPHKNHLNLFLAVKECNKAGVNIRIVCSGRVLDRFRNPNDLAFSLGIGNQIITLGHVGRELLDFLYDNARAVVIPTKFEAASFPIYEAQSKGKAVACSSVTSLPEQVGDSALLFDPDNVNQIAMALQDLWLRDDLVRRLEILSKRNLANLAWDLTCKDFLSLYEEVLK